MVMPLQQGDRMDVPGLPQRWDGSPTVSWVGSRADREFALPQLSVLHTSYSRINGHKVSLLARAYMRLARFKAGCRQPHAPCIVCTIIRRSLPKASAALPAKLLQLDRVLFRA